MVHVQLKSIPEGFEVGQQLNVTDMFKEGDLVDIAGKSIGKGFQGENQISEVNAEGNIHWLY